MYKILMKQEEMFKFKVIIAVVLALVLFIPAVSQEKLKYQMPPKEIADLADAPMPPGVRISPDAKWMLLLGSPGLPSIEELAQPELRLAGLRINPATSCMSRTYYNNYIKLKNLADLKEYDITGIPPNAKIGDAGWSPDSRKVAFTITVPNGRELWYFDVDSIKAVKLTGPVVSDLFYSEYKWMPDSKKIIYKSVFEGRGKAPAENIVPAGPVVSETQGVKAPARTYQDLLKSPYDEDLFEYYATTRLKSVDLDGNSANIGKPGMIWYYSPSPDGQYLLTYTIKRPFSYLVPYYRFPHTISICDTTGNIVRTMADIPLTEALPLGFDAVRTGRRRFMWRSDKPAELFWVEAQDGGDPERASVVRDILYALKAPFDGTPNEILKFKQRFSSIIWGNDSLAIAYERWWKTRHVLISSFSPEQGLADSAAVDKNVLFDRSSEDAYGDPGNFFTVPNQYGRSVLKTAEKGRYLFLTGKGSSPEGDRPFLRLFDINTKNKIELFRSQAPYYEYMVDFVNTGKKLILTRRESATEPPNYFIRNFDNGDLKQITFFKNPYPILDDVSKKLITYQRDDGVELSATLYLPPDFEKGTRLPVLVWAYPQEYKSASAAGQIKDSPYRFSWISPQSPLIWLAEGYAILDDPSMPIIGKGNNEPNDTYVNQLTEDAKAAVEAIVKAGIADSNRIAIGGHSYGAFMAANLLAHTDLFAAGIARSGAYNRTLTPFGFQAEERTFWQAPVTYIKMSPFMFADKINEPLLLIHGMKDNNSGTFPMQSERFYDAIKGNGGTARLVLLPDESHGYRARESVMHMLWEMNEWLDKYVKNRKVDAQEK